MIIENIIRQIKGNPDYKWETNYTGRDLFYLMAVRGFQLARGLFLKLFLKKSKGLLFKGRNVCIRHKYQITAGKHLILDDNVYINALSYDGITFGNNVSIGRDTTIVCTGVIANKGKGISIGEGCGITTGVFLGGQGGITIGKNVIIGPGAKFFSENHSYSEVGIPIKDQGTSRKGITVGDNCWIGGGAIILDGVRIGEGSVVAAGSVVTSSVDPNSIVAGVPAKFIKNRIV